MWAQRGVCSATRIAIANKNMKAQIEKYIPFNKELVDRIGIPNHLIETSGIYKDLSGIVITNLNGNLTKLFLMQGVNLFESV